MTSPFRKVHLGCGAKVLPGFCHIDVMPQEHLDYCADIKRLDFIPDNSADLIYCSHVLEHFGRWEIPAVLQEWFRITAPGGVLRVAVPDFAACAAIYYEQGLVDGLTGLMGLICGGQKDDHDYHKAIFDEAYLSQLLLEAGYGTVRQWDWRATEHAHIDDFSQAYLPHMNKETGRLMSLNLEAVK